MWCMELSLRCCAEMNIHRDLRWVSQRISVVSSRESSHLWKPQLTMDSGKRRVEEDAEWKISMSTDVLWTS